LAQPPRNFTGNLALAVGAPRAMPFSGATSGPLQLQPKTVLFSADDASDGQRPDGVPLRRKAPRLRELKKQEFDKPIIGETTIIGQKVIKLAGLAAEGILGHVRLTPDAPRLP